MTLPVSAPAEIAETLAYRSQGFRYCYSCQRATVEGPTWKLQCADCFAAKEKIEFCQQCAGEIDETRRRWFRCNAPKSPKRGDCWYCSKGTPKPCDACSVPHPAKWDCTKTSDLVPVLPTL